MAHDYDWIVIGSGFGGSVSALRLAEKGHRVAVLEAGRRFEDDDFPHSTWDLRNYFFAPRAGMRGIFRLSIFKDVSIVSGAGVGGGSLVYANTLYRAPGPFYRDPQWADLADWGEELRPHYDTAERMLGVVMWERDDPADQLLREYAGEIRVEETYTKVPVGIFVGEPGVTVPDPYFGGEGPARTGCRLCGRCMVGCPYNAKNTLVKNYLYLAEKRGVEILPERTAIYVAPGGREDGSEGYEVTSVRSGTWFRRDKQVYTARGVVLAAGALGTNRLLHRCRAFGTLPRLSARVGELVRTNSEAILAVTLPRGHPADLTKRIAITGSIYPDPDTHIETVTYGAAGDSIGGLYTLLVGDGTRVTRPIRLVATILRHPAKALRLASKRGWSERTIILLVMQTLDNAIALRGKKRPFGGLKMQTEQDRDRPNPTYIEAANKCAEWLAERTDGIAQSSITEALLSIPTTAHILGGATIAADPEHGVVDRDQRVFGYENLLVCDGSVVPANIGVNPSLTITALAERAMSKVPAKTG